MNKAIFFDLDGTLWDAISVIKDSYNKAMKDCKEKYTFDYEMVKSYMGLTPLETVKLAFKDLDEKDGLRLFNICFKEEISYLSLHPGTLYPDEEKVLSELSKKYSLYIVSNSDKGYVENYLNAYNFNKYFVGHVCAGDTGLSKAENILYLKKKENLDEVVYVGDTLKDFVESEKASVVFIHASYGFGKIINTKYRIKSLKELPCLLDEILI